MGGEKRPLRLAVAPQPLRSVGVSPLLFDCAARPSALPAVERLPVLPPAPSPPRCFAIPPPVVFSVVYFLFYFCNARGLAALGSTSPTSRPKKKIEIPNSGSWLPGRSPFFCRAPGAKKSGTPFQLDERRSSPGLPHPAPEVAPGCVIFEVRRVPSTFYLVLFCT